MFQNSLEMTESDKHSSLVWYGELIVAEKSFIVQTLGKENGILGRFIKGIEKDERKP
jgi:hypothetical protein